MLLDRDQCNQMCSVVTMSVMVAYLTTSLQLSIRHWTASVVQSTSDFVCAMAILHTDSTFEEGRKAILGENYGKSCRNWGWFRVVCLH